VSIRSDSFSQFDHLLTAALADPWAHARGATPVYAPDYGLLGRLLTIPTAAHAVSESGNFANSIDSWIATELRRAGFG